MGELGAALLWYQKKIGAYDQQLWERNVEQHILRNVDELPKKTAKLKPELIDVDLVRGSAFPKAKPQHGWISTTFYGVIRVMFLPFYCSWWKQQTSQAVCIGILFLYFLQVAILYFYFTSDDSEFQNVSTSEIMTPVAMMISLGIVHSQIVSTVSNKINRTGLRRSKRKRLKRSPRMESIAREYDSKSSPETASEDRLGKVCDDSHDADSVRLPTAQNSSNAQSCERPFPLAKSKNSDEESGLDSMDFAQPIDSEPLDAANHCGPDNLPNLVLSKPTENDLHISKAIEGSALGSGDPQSISISAQPELRSDKPHETHQNNVDGSLKISYAFNQPCNDGSSFLSSHVAATSASSTPNHRYPFENRPLADISNEDFGDVSSGDEFFVTRHKDFQEQQSYGNTPNHRRRGSLYGNRARSSAERQIFPLCWRRFSDIDHGKPGKQNPSLDRMLINDSFRRFSEGHPFNSAQINLGTGIKRMNNGVPLMAPDRTEPYSSCESEEDTTPTTPNKPQSSDVEWPIMTNTDCNSDSTDSAVSDQEDDTVPSSFDDPDQEAPGHFFSHYSGSDKGRCSSKVSCTIWERKECKKVDLTVLDISSSIIMKVDRLAHSSEYLIVGLLCALIIAVLPMLFRLPNTLLMEAVQGVVSDVLTLNVPSSDGVATFGEKLIEVLLGSKIRNKFVILSALLERFTLSAMYFFILAVAEKTFKQRFLYAKHFCHLTSVRRARRSDLPHFRLNKVRNIKTWLSVRSYLKKHGPQRSVDVVVSTAFIIIVCLLSFLCLQLLKESEQFTDRLYCWEIVFWCLALGLFLMRFMMLGTKINKKYRNLSALTTEQINLYLHMEQKPHKKEELMLANNVLKLAIDLLKELENPFKISGLRANPYLYNITKVVVLSAFSAVLTELLGFKLKLHKIKIK